MKDMLTEYYKVGELMDIIVIQIFVLQEQDLDTTSGMATIDPVLIIPKLNLYC